jgi:hypothetical protein
MADTLLSFPISVPHRPQLDALDQGAQTAMGVGTHIHQAPDQPDGAAASGIARAAVLLAFGGKNICTSRIVFGAGLRLPIEHLALLVDDGTCALF